MKAKIYTTTFVNETVASNLDIVNFIDDELGQENNIINLYPKIKYQKILGFGGALTETSAYVYSLAGDANKKAVLEKYFGEHGLGYNFCRTHIDSCDFSLGHYNAVNDEQDENLSTFSMERSNKYIIPFIKMAESASRKKIDFLLSPWSPPAFMKTNADRNNGGKLLPEYNDRWAEYIVRYVREFQLANINVWGITVQNEPKAVQPWDSCVFTPQEEAAFIQKHLRPALANAGLGNLPILIWDHNKERMFDWAEDLFGGGVDAQGVAFHWYSGDHFEALALVREKYPDKLLIFTEGCVEYSKYDSGDQLKSAQMYAHDMIGNFNNGMNAFIDWNILLDENGGPNHVGNYCDAPLILDCHSDVLYTHLSYEYIGHFSKFIHKNARRIAFTNYSQALQLSAFENTDGTIAVVIMNSNEQSIDICLRLHEKLCSFIISAQSIATIIISSL